MDNDIAQSIKDLKRAVLGYKTGQMTQGDSANYYCVNYLPGWYVSDENHWREHTIKCIPYNNEKNAIFSAQMVPSEGWHISGFSASGRNIFYGQEYITWNQIGETSSKLSNTAYAAGVPKGIAILSNVDFYIETSYVDKSF